MHYYGDNERMQVLCGKKMNRVQYVASFNTLCLNQQVLELSYYEHIQVDGPLGNHELIDE